MTDAKNGGVIIRQHSLTAAETYQNIKKGILTRKSSCQVEDKVFVPSSYQVSGGITISEDVFGQMPDGDTVYKITVSNKHNYSFEILTYGATLRSLKVPNFEGGSTDVVLGYDTLDEYIDSSVIMGGVIGRVAHRIHDGTFQITTGKETKDYTLTKNDRNLHHLNGGYLGLNTKNFKFSVKGSKVILMCKSDDMEEGYPGNLRLAISFQLNSWDEFTVDYEATADAVTPLNLSHSIYFNLGGQGSGSVINHRIQLPQAEHYLPTSKADPREVTGAIENVHGTAYDIRTPKPVGELIKAISNDEHLEQYFCIKNAKSSVFSEEELGKLYDERTGILMEMETSCRGAMLLSYQHPLAEATNGKGGQQYGNGDGIAIIASGYPDCLRFPGVFPEIRHHLGEVYYRTTHFKFSLTKTFPIIN